MGFFDWSYWHLPVHKRKERPEIAFQIATTTAESPNGIIGTPTAAGGVKLVCVEDCRAQCAASSDASLRELGAALKTYWAWPPALNDPSLTLTAVQHFNIMSNSVRVHGLIANGPRFLPIFTDNRPDPAGRKLWLEGDSVADHGAFDSNVTLDTVGPILVAAMQRSVLQL